jgi:putative RecB family exonuclease
MEQLYKDLKFKKALSLKEALDYFNKSWSKNWTEGIRIIRSRYTEDNYRQIGEQCISDYYARYFPFDQGNHIALEKKYYTKLDEDLNISLVGVIDRLTYAGDGVYEIHDYKTNMDLPQQKFIEKDTQLALYSLFIKENYKDCKEVKLIWHFLAFDKELSTQKTDFEIENLKQDTIKRIQEIENMTEYTPKPSGVCNWCDYRSRCPEHAHEHKIELLSPEQFQIDSGVTLVNLLNYFQTAKKQVDSQFDMVIDFLKTSLQTHADLHEITTIHGADAKVSVKEQEYLTLPKTGTEERKNLEALILKNNSWREVSSLDRHKIKKLIEESWSDQRLVAEIEPLVSKKKSKSVRLYSTKKEK